MSKLLRLDGIDSDEKTTTSSYCTLIGRKSDVEGSFSIVLGSNNMVRGDRNVVFGSNNTVTGHRNIVLGDNLEVTGNDKIVISDVVKQQDFDELKRRAKIVCSGESVLLSIAHNCLDIIEKAKETEDEV